MTADSWTLSPSPDEDDSLSLVKDNSHNSSFELAGSMITCYQPVSHQRSTGRGVPNSSIFRSPSPCLFRPSFLSSASKVRKTLFPKVGSRAPWGSKAINYLPGVVIIHPKVTFHLFTKTLFFFVFSFRVLELSRTPSSASLWKIPRIFTPLHPLVLTRVPWVLQPWSQEETPRVASPWRTTPIPSYWTPTASLTWGLVVVLPPPTNDS